MSSVVISGDTSGSVTLQAPAVAGTTVLTLPATSGTVITGAGGVTSVASGGTGANTLTANNVILGNGTSAVAFVAPGSNGNLLTSNGSTWVSSTPAGGGVTSLNGQTGAITNTDYGVIGSYVVAAENNYSSTDVLAPNVTVAGSALGRQNSTGTSASSYGINGQFSTLVGPGGNLVNLSLSGTWRRMTQGQVSSTGSNTPTNLYVRIS